MLIFLELPHLSQTTDFSSSHKYYLPIHTKFYLWCGLGEQLSS